MRTTNDRICIKINEERSRREILLAGIKGFNRIVEEVRKGKRSLNRNRKENMEVRMLRKFNAKSRWYKGKKGEKERGRGAGRNSKVEKKDRQKYD